MDAVVWMPQAKNGDGVLMKEPQALSDVRTDFNGQKVTQSSAMQPVDEAEAPTCTIHICTSCRPPGTPREPKSSRPGFIFYEKLREAVADSVLSDQVAVVPTPCLSVCPRPCGFALSLPGSWTYLFGDQQPNQTESDIIDCVSLYLKSPDGFMERHQRPKPLRASILGRVPPIQGGGQCT